MNRPSSPQRRLPRSVALVASCLAVAATVAATLVSTATSTGSPRPAAELRRAAAIRAAAPALERARATAPVARGGRCVRTAAVPGQGRSCRTRDGMFVLPRPGGVPLLSHGPDLLGAAPAGAAPRARAGRAGVADPLICSSSSSTRHVVLLYLLTSDHASGLPDVHGDRYAEVAPQMRHALLDAAAIVDARAGELAPGERRRLRVRCDADGQPTVLRVELPRTALQYRSPRAGFVQLIADLEELGLLPEYDDFSVARTPAVMRALAYYDADFLPGVAGQGSMFQRRSMLKAGFKAADPLLSRSTRNINNNPPVATLAVQYGTALAGVPEPPLSTALLHELSHTMGAVQDDVPTSSGKGHCVDGLDVMCYADPEGTVGTYSPDACPDAAPPVAPLDERFDCNGDSYFHPAPPVGNPLASPTVWQLGLRANETLSASTTAMLPPGGVARIASRGTGTRQAVRWSRGLAPAGPAYELAWRPVGGNWTYERIPGGITASPTLRPFTAYELEVAAISRLGILGPRATMTLRTGRDDTPPTAPTAVRIEQVGRTRVGLSFEVAIDNVRAGEYRVEVLVGRQWRLLGQLTAPSGESEPGSRLQTPAIPGLQPATAYRARVRARDAAGNVSAPSDAKRFTTQR